MKQKGISPIIILLIIVVLAMVGYFGYSKGYFTKNHPTPIPIPVPSLPIKPTPSSTSVIDTSKWKTFEYSKQGFSFKYPENLSYATLSNGVLLFLNNMNGDYENCKKELHLEGTSEFENTSCWTKPEFVFNGARIISQNEYDQLQSKTNKAGFLLDVFKDSQGRTWKISEATGEGTTFNFEAYILADNGKYYSMLFQAQTDNDEVETLFKQILSTFKFTQ